MNNRTKNLRLLALALAITLAVIALAQGSGSHAAEGESKPCAEVVTVIDEAWFEVIEHPAITEVVHHEAVTETTPAIWANWSPNDTRGPQDYAPIWPTDERGTWHIHEQGIPGGHEGPDGVYQQGGGNSSWFYRQAEKVVVISEAYDETVVIEEAWTETIEHKDSSHEEVVEVDCPPAPPLDECADPVTGEDLCVHEEPETPNPEIQIPDEPGETVTFQSFDGEGNLVEQRVSKPIPAEAKQEGL